MLTRKTYLWLLLGMLLSVIPFWLTDLDILVTSLFYVPAEPANWPLSETPFWSFFYHTGPMISTLVAVSCLLFILGALLIPSWKSGRRSAYFVLAVYLVAPGIIVNALLKDNWGRPRPDQVVEFGGIKQYEPPLLFDSQSTGKSFPSGHSSVGFSLIALWFIWRHSRPRLARFFLWGSIVLGSLLGAQRIMNGAHFLSDVLWSAWIPILVASGLYYLFFERRPKQQQADQGFGLTDWSFTLLAIVVGAASLLVFPVERESHSTASLHGIDRVCIYADALQLRINRQPPKATDTLTSHYRGKGFGLVGSQVHFNLEEGDKHLLYRVNTMGLLTEWNDRLHIKLPNDKRQLVLISNKGKLLNPGKLPGEVTFTQLKPDEREAIQQVGCPPS